LPRFTQQRRFHPSKLVKRFLESASYETQSLVQLNGVTGSTTVQTAVNVKTVMQHPNRFRSEITFAKPEQPSATITTLIVSNGQQVWFYRPDLKQYQMMTYKEFEQFDDSYWLGFSTMIYGQVPPDVRRSLSQNELISTEVVQAVGLELKELQGAAQTIEGRPVYVYRYKDAKEGFTFSAFVVPDTANIERFQVTGKTAGTDVVVSEQILSRTANPAIAPNTFTFTPPSGIRKVKVLSIGPL
jgi:outer membrane lipoprotein-sorting protein